MPIDQQYLDMIERKLAAHAPSLALEFKRASDDILPVLSESDYRLWAEEGVELAEHSLRSWEAAVDYFRVSTQVMRALNTTSFRRWAHAGRDLAEYSSVVAAAFFRASPKSVAYLDEHSLIDWASLGKRLYKGHWKSISLASAYFAASPGILSTLTLKEIAHLVALVEQVAERSYELAGACLDAAPALFQALDKQDRAPFLVLAAAVGDASWADVRICFERSPNLLQPIDPGARSRFLALAAEVARRSGRHAYALFSEGAMALAGVPKESHHDLLAMAEELAAASPVAAMEFLKSSPEVLKRIRVSELAHWHAAGHRILTQSLEGGEAYFRLESGKGEEVLQQLSSRVDLARVGEVLRLYCKALTGTNVSIQPVSYLAEKGIGWVSEERPSTEGTTVFLPEFVEEFVERELNFSVYKVYATHQAAHLEFGSFFFRFNAEGAVLPARRHEVEARRLESGAQQRRERGYLTEMERFFDLFDDRQLASDIFAIAEDTRIDTLVRREYGGIRRAWQRTQENEVERRRLPSEMPLRQAFVENLVRASLDATDSMIWPAPLRPLLADALRALFALKEKGAVVEDTAEATLALYEIAAKIPNIPPDQLDDFEWETVTEDMMQLMMSTPGEGGEGESQTMPTGTEMDYESPDQVDFRGDFKPELVQLLMRLRLKDGEVSQDSSLSPLTQEQLAELFEKSVEITVGAMAEGDLASTLGLFLSNLEKEAGTPIGDQQQGELQDGTPGVEESPDEQEMPVEVKSFYYDEWDFRAADYKPRWCRVQERVLDEGSEEFFDGALREHAQLVAETRKQFELLKPELYRKMKRLLDGEEFDFDAVIDWAVERKAGTSYTDKVYWRRNKIERDVAVAFLLDMSASTDEEIEKRKQKYADDDDFDDDPRKYFQWLAQRRAAQAIAPPKRIIDLEKESTVLFIKALETIGDAYGIYGFSGYGRDNVEFYVIKDFDEQFSDKVKKRVDKVSPIRSTRMGPAIRHAIHKLDTYDAKVKILMLVSDGRPQDHGYGRDRTEKEYAIHDTKQALTEARRKGITPFALTVDKEGHDYLGQMCEDMGYEVVADIEQLPQRLPTLYRRLTE
ncbi:MAG TPA: VWA domain-containing protein [Dehalococcoidia bacterium]|nr:VWA domain-containing protein [Dehalococcoidia bacterium]